MTDIEKKLFQSLFRKFREYSSRCKEGSTNSAVFLTATMIFGWLCDEPVYREQFDQFVRHWEAFTESPTNN